MAYTPALGAGAARRGGSTPLLPTQNIFNTGLTNAQKYVRNDLPKGVTRMHLNRCI